MSEDFPSYEELEAKLWMAEHARDELSKEAHDKHWPLANACRNLLPHAETNIEQVSLVAEELKSAESAVADLMEVNDQLRAEYQAYRETAVVEADQFRKEKAELIEALYKVAEDTLYGVVPRSHLDKIDALLTKHRGEVDQ